MQTPDVQPNSASKAGASQVAATANSGSGAPAVALGAALEPKPSAPPEQPLEATQPAEEPRIVLAAGGDVNFGRECGQAILKDVAYDPFAGLGVAWSSADLRFVNLESQLSDQKGVTQDPLHRLIFTGPPGGADVLSQAGISVVSTANNHAWDYGKRAFFETIANLNRAQVPFVGTGLDAKAAYAPVVLRVKERSVALFAVTHIWNPGVFHTHEGRNYVAWADVKKLRSGIQRARREHDFVLVSYHGGAEYMDTPMDGTRRFAAAMMALGVDAVIGHHPHVPQGVGWYDGRPILYSLGNFVFAGHDDKPWTKSTFFVRLTLQKGSAPLLDACPIAIDGHRPRSHAVEEQPAIERVRQHIIDTSASVGGASVAAANEFGCLRVTAPEAKLAARAPLPPQAP
jgi:poly-gamma-glutamate capsule biosynthesis protein CapA/YwtB (metallophosphatase superfamily)